LEGLSQDPAHLHPLQEAFVTQNSSQCGFCTPGIIMSSKALLNDNPDPSREEVKVALSGNICRCTDYSRYIDAVILASKEMRQRKNKEEEQKIPNV
ncbi:MAG: (2Fe-2S)-binding protein, partial [Rhabdochlamydiaceae bacterium]